MKTRLRPTIAAFGLAIFNFSIAVVEAQFNYTINGGTITITRYTGPSGMGVVIPDTINVGGVDLPVTGIAGEAIQPQDNVTCIMIGTNLTSIGYRAFDYCYSLLSISVNPLNSVYCSVDYVLFDKNQTTLIVYPARLPRTSYTIPNSVTSIGDYAFCNSAILTTISIPDSVTSIGYQAFDTCTGLSTITIPNSVTNIGNEAFQNCTSLTSLAIPSSASISIGASAFSGCTKLISITIPESVTSIGDWAFVSCVSLTGVYCRGNAPSVGNDVFLGANNATVYYLPGTTRWTSTFGGRPTAMWDLPTIQTPPQTQTAEAGSAVGLRVKASSPLPLFYFWYLNDTNLLSCGTNWQLDLPNVQSSQSGAYTVVISNACGAVTSSPAMLQVIPAVQRSPVPGVKVTGETASLLNVDYSDSLNPAPNWTPLGSVSLASTTGYCCDLTLPLPPQRFYRAWQTGTPGVRPALDLHLVPAITLTGTIGHSVRLDYINHYGPIDAWVTLDTVTLTNPSQLYFDVSAPGQPQRLYRLVQVP
jgi:hypothetical protein